jgi:hypothetical protein
MLINHIFDNFLVLNENTFLLFLGLFFLIGAVMQDFKRREVDNVWNFSLIAFALGYRAIISVYILDYHFLLNGLIGLGIFFILGNVFYYGRLFAGGDAKLLIALGAVLPLDYGFLTNIKISLLFVMLFLIGGSIYSIFYSIFLIEKNWKNFKREFFIQLKYYKKIIYFSICLFLFLTIISLIYNKLLFIIAILFFIFPFLTILARSIEESCMVKKIPVNKLTIGDWLYRDIKVKNKKIEKNWEGISESELKLIQRYYKKKVLIKEGIPFTPSFLIAFILLFYLMNDFLFWF